MAYVSWTFLKMGEKADRKTAFVFLLIALAPILFMAVFSLMIGAALILYISPVLVPMLLPFYLPFALRKEAVTTIRSGNILMNKNPLVVTYKPVLRNWAYAVYAVVPVFVLVLIDWQMSLEDVAPGLTLTGFSLVWISLFAIFLMLSVMLGKIGYLKPAHFLLAAAGNLVLMWCYSLWAW